MVLLGILINTYAGSWLTSHNGISSFREILVGDGWLSFSAFFFFLNSTSYLWEVRLGGSYPVDRQPILHEQCRIFQKLAPHLFVVAAAYDPIENGTVIGSVAFKQGCCLELAGPLHLLETLLRSRHCLNRSVVTQRKEQQKRLARQKIGVLFLIGFPSWQPTKAKAKTQWCLRCGYVLLR